MNCLTFDQIRELAIKDNIPDNKVSIGVWAKYKGYIKKRKQKHNKVSIMYCKDEQINNN